MSAKTTVFLTGFPGFIASRLVARLATPDTRFFLLVQAPLVESAKESILKIVAENSLDPENFEIAVGDITEPDLGMSYEDVTRVIEETTDVYHLAAVYDLAVAAGPARLVNVEGTRNVNDLVRKVRNLRRYNYVSTCYVAGRRTGIILESELEHDAGFRNHYEETKYLAELEVEKLKAELPVTIFRPSVVVGDSKSGETPKFDGIYAVILYLMRFPSLLRLVNVGNDAVRLNLVPVDFVVEAIAALANDVAATGKTIAVADPNPQTTAEIFDAAARAVSGKHSAIKPPAALIEFCLSLPFSPVLTGLPHVGVPYFFIEQSYDTSVSESLLRRHGISCPRFSDYVPNIVEFVRRRRA